MTDGVEYEHAQIQVDETLNTLKPINCNLFMPSFFNLCTFHVICESVIIAMTDDIDYERI